MFFLIVGDRRIPLPPGRHVIGRAPSCDIQLHDKMVSRQHASLHVSPNAVVLDDEGSMNGILIDGDPAVTPVRIEPGKAFEIGPFKLHVVLDTRAAWERQVTVQLSTAEIMDAADDDATSRDLGPILPARMDGYLEYAEAALAESNLHSVDRAGRNLRHQLEIGAISPTRCSPESLAKLVAFALGLASEARDCSWLDCVFVLARKRGEVLSPETISGLEKIAGEADLANNTFFRIYLTALRRRRDLEPEEEQGIERMKRLVSVQR